MLQYPHSHLVVPLRNLKQTPPPQPVPVQARLPTPPLSPLPVTASKPASASQWSSHSVSDLLATGDIIGEGLVHNGELVSRVDLQLAPEGQHLDCEPGQHFEVVRKLGSGSYAVVYLVREYFGPLDDSHSSDDLPAGDIELDGPAPATATPRYGREFAIKCLSKENLSKDSLQAQLLEATVHQSLPVHPHIVTLYRTLETASLLLLVLESVPGEDLFYFLEQARDQHVDLDPHAPSLDLSVTPPTPSLLSSFQPAQLLSYGRLRLIASMFAQMCDAVAHCHANGIAHRDIKPENFIVTDAWTEGPDGRRERRVVVKLTDFGLATTDIESADMECGSAPYMSYECRNNLAPTYYPRPADVWSLGIVLINMVYHRNPWSDTSIGACEAFELFRENSLEFFMKSFYGMTRDVAEYLSESVFCILEQPDDTRRVSAKELGAWVKNLPQLMGARPHPAAGMTVDTSEQPQQRRQRKRGTRKGKSASAARDSAFSSSASLPSPEDDRLEHLAKSNQDLVRELSRLSTRSSVNSLQSSMRSQSLQPPPPVPSLPSPQRKTSRWKGVFSLKQQSAAVSPPSEPEVIVEQEPAQMSATVSNVSSLIMGLSAPAAAAEAERGRRREREDEPGMLSPRSPDWSQSRESTDPDSSRRNVSPLSTRSRGAASTLGPSFQSNNWRNSMSSSASSINAGSAYTRFSNASVRSVSTAATSMSGSSWRTGPSAQVQLDKSGQPLRRPSNVKEMNGVPWELHELPRHCHLDPRKHVFDSPPAPKAPKAPRPARRQEGTGLSTIAEGRNGSGNASGVGSPPKLSVYTQTDASTSTTGLSPPQSPSTADGGPKKVNKGQINTLAKILSTLKSR